MATKADIKEIVTTVTDAFDSLFKYLDKNMVTRDEFEPFKKSTEQSLYELKSDVSDLKDDMRGVKGRLDTLEFKFDELTGMYRGHDVRIVRLEKAIGV